MNRVKSLKRKHLQIALGATFITLATASLSAQGILTVTPGRTASTAAGTGTAGYTANGPASSATLASPAAVVYDASGNLYVADTNNHVVREILKSNGSIVTVAGNATQGFSGDGGPAIAAQLDTPTGVAVDATGGVYIADSHNHRIRKVANGTITTVAGTGTAGFSGDGAAATAAALSLPSAVAVDAAGSLYIADTNNQRVRKVSNSTITTVAGTGDQALTGDGVQATASALDSPAGVAVDATGTVYIADRHNQRVRAVSPSGIITTVAGSGAPTFAGGFSGDGASAAAAALSSPSSVSIDSAGNIYVADTNNQRIRQINGGSIATISGNANQGFDGDGSAASAATLDTPRGVAVDAAGNLAIADTLNQRVRSESLPVLNFTSIAGAGASAPQTVTLTNSGTASLTVSSVAFAGQFALAAGGTCSSAPFALAAGASCTESIAYSPSAAGASSGSVAFAGTGIATQTVLLTGTGTTSGSSISLASSAATPFINSPVVFTATVSPASATGTVSFFTNGALIGTAPVSAGQASISTTFAAAGTYAITSVYSGSAGYTGSTSATLTQQVGDFSFTLTPDPSNPGTGTDFSITVIPGGAGVYKFVVQPLNGPFTFPITLSASGLPSTFTTTFSPQTVTLGPNPASFTMTVQTPKTLGALRFGEFGGAAAALLVLPFAGRLRRKGLHRLTLCVLSIGSVTAMLALTGCGSGTGFFGQPSTTYTIQVTATARGATGAALQHVTTVKLVVQ